MAKHGQGKKGPDYFRGALGLLHATYIGYHGYAHEWLADNPRADRRIAQSLRLLVLPAARQPAAKLRPGTEVRVDVRTGRTAAWRRPIIPIGCSCDGRAEETVEQDFDAGNRRWLPEAEGTVHRTVSRDAARQHQARDLDAEVQTLLSRGRRDVLVALQSGTARRGGFLPRGRSADRRVSRSLATRRPGATDSHG